MLIDNDIVDEKTLKFLLNYITVRLDIINISENENKIDIIESSDSNAGITFPKWFKHQNSQGAIATSSNLSWDFKIKCGVDGVLKIKLKSVDIKGVNKQRFPIYVDINEFKVNEEVILKKHNLISFSHPKKFSKNVKKDEVVNIHLKWMPFNNQCEYNSPLIPLENKINKLSNELEFYKSDDGSSVNNIEIFKLNDEVLNLKKKFNDYEKNISNYLDSYHFLFENIYLSHELTSKGYLNQLHNVYGELLAFVDNVCEKHGLNWWLDYGNLLGAVRHEGFIPWDDDVDIGMMRTDYLKFYDILVDEIKENKLDDVVKLHFRQRVIDYRRASSFLQIYFYSNDLDNKRLLANIDVFPYDYINEYDKRDIEDLYYNTKMNYFNNLINNKSPEESLKIMYSELNLNLDKTDLIIPGIEGACGPDNTYPLSVYNADKIFPLTRIKFSDRMFPCPNDTHYYLKRIYGDYLSLPKIVRSHRRNKKFKYSENRKDLYTNLLKIFREVNSKY